MSKSNIQERAAAHFGMQGDPRTSVKVGRYKVVLIAPHGRSRVMAVYSEELREPRGEYLYFEGGVPDALVEALR